MSAGPPPRPDLPVMRHPRDGGGLARSASGQAAGIELWEPVPSPEAPGFRTLWQAISRRKRIITLVFAGTVLAIGAWTLTTRPVYTATSRSGSRRRSRGSSSSRSDQERRSHARLLPDPAAAPAEPVAREPGDRAPELDQHPEFTDAAGASAPIDRLRALGRKLLADGCLRPAAAPPEAREDLALESPLTRVFVGRLAVEPVRNARLVKVSFESHYAATGRPGRRTRWPRRSSADSRASGRRQPLRTGFLGRQMDEARGRLEKAEERLSAFVGEKGMNFVGSDRLREREDLVTRELSTLSDAFVKARNERIAKESLAQEARQGDGDSVPTVLQSPVVVKLKGELATLEAQQRELAQTFRPEYPRCGGSSRTSRSFAARSAARSAGSSGQSRRTTAPPSERARDREGDGHQRAQASSLGDHLVQYNILRRDVDASRELYTSLLTRLKETQISGDLVTSPISIVDRAEVPLSALAPAQEPDPPAGRIGRAARRRRRGVRDRSARPETPQRQRGGAAPGSAPLGLVPERRRAERAAALLAACGDLPSHWWRTRPRTPCQPRPSGISGRASSTRRVTGRRAR